MSQTRHIQNRDSQTRNITRRVRTTTESVSLKGAAGFSTSDRDPLEPSLPPVRASHCDAAGLCPKSPCHTETLLSPALRPTAARGFSDDMFLPLAALAGCAFAAAVYAAVVWVG